MEPKRALLALLMFLGELRLRAGAGNRVSWPAMKTLMGRSPEVTVRDLTPGAKYTLAAEMTDAVLHVWALGIDLSPIPHSDGAGVIDRVGKGMSESREGERVWCFGAQSYPPFGTAAEFVVVPVEQAIPLPDGISFEQGACLGIPGITAHRAVHVAGSVTGRTVLVQSGAGAVGQCAVGLARHAGALVIATVRSEPDRAAAERAGAHRVVFTRGLSPEAVVERVLAHAPAGIQHIVEVAFAANVALDEAVLSPGGSIATYATNDPRAEIPFWPLVFKNVRIDFLGSDDFSGHAKVDAARDLNEAPSSGWPGFVIDERFALEAIADAHEWIEERKGTGRSRAGHRERIVHGDAGTLELLNPRRLPCV